MHLYGEAMSIQFTDNCAPTDFAMSNTLLQLVPVFNDNNWQAWSKSMISYLMSVRLYSALMENVFLLGSEATSRGLEHTGGSE